MKLENIKLQGEIFPPASVENILKAEHALGIDLPVEYSDFLKVANGAYFENGIRIYPLDELVERNETLEVTEYAPGFLAIGDDNSEYVFIVDQTLKPSPIFMVFVGSMDPDDKVRVGDSLESWLQSGCPRQ